MFETITHDILLYKLGYCEIACDFNRNSLKETIHINVIHNMRPLEVQTRTLNKYKNVARKSIFIIDKLARS